MTYPFWIRGRNPDDPFANNRPNQGDVFPPDEFPPGFPPGFNGPRNPPLRIGDDLVNPP